MKKNQSRIKNKNVLVCVLFAAALIAALAFTACNQPTGSGSDPYQGGDQTNPGEQTNPGGDQTNPGGNPTLTGITAVYNGTAIIYPTTPLDDLKTGLTVTAVFSDSTTQPVTGYTLSGTLTVGTSTITVSYEGKTTTFTVTVTLPGFTTAPVLSLDPGYEKIDYSLTASDPAADSYDLYYKAGSGLSASVLKDTGNGSTKITVAVGSGTITGLTNGTEYSFIVTANKAGYTSVDSVVEEATPADLYYVISGSGSTFSATRNGAAFGTTGAIQTVINAIRTNAAGAPCIIQFGAEGATLSTGSTAVSFNNTGGTWGTVELSGKITSTVTCSLSSPSGTIVIADAVSVTSVADITNTATATSTEYAFAICHNSTGTLTISGGDVQATYNSAYVRAIQNNSAGTVNITGGLVRLTGQSNTSNAVYNNAGGAVNISAGEIRLEGTGGIGVYNASTGTVTISGGIINKGGTNSGGRMVYNNSTGTVNITGGTVTAKSDSAVYNFSTGTINVSGGTVEITAGINATTGAICNNNDGTINISGGTVRAAGVMSIAVVCGNGYLNISQGPGEPTLITSENTYNYATIYLGGTTAGNRNPYLNMTGGTVENTASANYAGRKPAVINLFAGNRGKIDISGGTVRAFGTGIAVRSTTRGVITVSGGTVTSETPETAYGTIFLEDELSDDGITRLVITGGTVANTSATTGNAIRNDTAGLISISGGTVSKAGSGDYAVYRKNTPTNAGQPSGTVTIGPGATIIGNNFNVP